MKDLKNDRFHNNTPTQNMMIETNTPDTPYIHTIELIEEPPQLILPISEFYERVLQEANSTNKDAGGILASSSRKPFFSRYRKSFNFSLNAITKNLSNVLNNAYDKREMLRLKKSKTSIYSFMGKKDKAIRRWNRVDFVKCR